ncbi:MAG: formylglycine-generating enzyme family protein, partial [Magnetococcales bacterium]|nr:formylglycine-generating enzyme family protein [Magnetococcales bacterium]
MVGMLALLAGLPAWGGAGLINEWEPIEIGEVVEKAAVEVQPGKPWTEPVSGMAMVWIAPGCFKMGSPPRVEGRDADEGPVHSVCLSGYWIGKTEVTQGAWRRVMRNNPATFRKGDEYPVEHVSWEDAEGFIRKLNTMHPGDFFFRLPTESEWEFVCSDRGQGARYPGGNDP